MQNKLKIALIGGGNMATALIGGLLPEVTAPEYVHVVDPYQESLDKLAKQFGVSTALQIDTSIEKADIIILSVKPQQLRQVAEALVPYVSAQLILSIAAGIRSVDIARWLNGYHKIVRSMPNTPALIGKGVTGLYATSSVSPEQREAADHIMQAVGSTVWLDDESLIDAVTAVSGSGPAYVFYFIEAMQQAALELGLPAEQAMQLAMATFDGATQLALKSTDSVAVLREKVTSKGGTTYAALSSMEAQGVKTAIMQAVKAAAARGKELGDEFGAQS
ncbi:pyrroline-5-carboxylate reductase [Undibacterium sp. Rencai35W]|uniref:pyrroline-5-carboxylate reductase n=1 Tax=Undibacterium sp. Rencai35W TaxID=3413046 RepID=UPI003BF06AD5